jgi:hypothetical protein
MDLKGRLFFICLTVAGLILTASFYLSRQLPLSLVSLLPIAGMLLARRNSLDWLAYFSLAGFAALSAFGILLDIPLIPMAIASTSALASWDLLLESKSIAPGDRVLSSRLYTKIHLKSLGAALGLGLLGVGVGQLVYWKIPFVGMVGLVILTLFCLGHAMDYLKRLSSSD